MGRSRCMIRYIRRIYLRSMMGYNSTIFHKWAYDFIKIK